MFTLLVVLFVSCFQLYSVHFIVDLKDFFSFKANAEPNSTSIHCYDCNSANNSMCLEPSKYDTESVERFLRSTECEQGIFTHQDKKFFCRKIIQTILHKGHDSEVRVTRGCGWVRHHKNRECYKADNEDHLETVCQCFHDHCNGATGKTVAVVLMVVGLFCALNY